MINSQNEKLCFFANMGKQCSRFFLNRYFYLFLFCAACAISALEWEVYGALAFVSLICLILVLCDDIMAAAMPLMLLCVFVTNCYDSAQTFMKFAWMAVPAVACILFHFIVYRQKFSMGSSIWGLLAVSVAVSLGGVGRISGEEYFSPTSIYYTVFLGIGMVGLYLLLKSQLSSKRSYDLKERIVLILYVMGIFASFVILLNVLPDTSFVGGFKIVNNFQASNNLSTMIMFAMPCTFFFVRNSKFHLFSALLMAASMVLSGSRAGMIFGVVELALCIIVSAVWDKKNRFFYICLMLSAIGVIILFRGRIMNMLESAEVYPVVSDGEARMQLIDRAIAAFKEDPIFGHGLGYKGNYDVYDPKSGAMGWYHMMIPQVFASMGVVGIVAYLVQAGVQIRVVARSLKGAVDKEKALIFTLAMSYVGVFLMSQVNPGLFCPIPYGLMATVIFAVMDGDNGMGLFVTLAEKISKKKKNITAE
ncbi:MAG: O-antigen ligase family protein [Clostridia bacterium]|nr:O-antigen ligase family protein [Clostridia bacterium]